MSTLATALVEALPRLVGAPADPAVLELLAALATALERGELELDLAGAPPAEVSQERWPGWHRQALAHSPLAVEASALESRPEAPLVLEGDSLRWRRWHGQLQAVLAALIARAEQPLAETADPGAIAQAVERARQAGLDGQQQRAVAAVLGHGLVLLGGGPGTGKTSTVVQMLAAALGHRPALRLHLAAPTGKAASRLSQALRAGASGLDPELAARLSQAPCTTLHRLLESNGERFGRHRGHPLALDLLVVDEVSMVDLPLMQALVEALPAHCQLLLVGDPHQLAPVGPGAVLLELSRPERLQQLGAAAVQLQTTYRNNGAIAATAASLRDGAQAAATALLEHLQGLGPSDNLRWLCQNPRQLPRAVLEPLRQHQQRLAELAASLGWHNRECPEGWGTLLEELERCILLSPVRQGRWGVEQLHRQLLGDGFGRPLQQWPLGTPVLNRRNLAEHNLANGDIGVLVERPGPAGPERLVLMDGGRLFHPARLGEAEPALALTIHKSQGSQYGAVLLLLPPTRRWDPRLIYTGLTRARQQALVVTPEPGDWIAKP
jgi:exodeoxyribonuclease V alpha subunit